MKTMIGICCIAVAWAGTVARGSDNTEVEQRISTGRVALTGLERDTLHPDGTADGVGYFTTLQGIAGSLFSSETPSEVTAYFTFRENTFQTFTIPNGSITAQMILPARVTFYFDPNPNHDWSKPDTFSQGQAIAVFEWDENQSGITGKTVFGQLSARLISSEDFVFHDRTYNFKKLVPGGITFSFIGSFNSATEASFSFNGAAISADSVRSESANKEAE